MRQNSCSSQTTFQMKDGVVPTGNRRVVSSQRGSAPAVAMSLALTITAYCPIASVAKVMGSDLKTSTSSAETSTAAMSSPTPGLIRSAGSSNVKSFKNNFQKIIGELACRQGDAHANQLRQLLKIPDPIIGQRIS